MIPVWTPLTDNLPMVCLLIPSFPGIDGSCHGLGSLSTMPHLSLSGILRLTKT